MIHVYLKVQSNYFAHVLKGLTVKKNGLSDHENLIIGLFSCWCKQIFNNLSFTLDLVH